MQTVVNKLKATHTLTLSTRQLDMAWAFGRLRGLVGAGATALLDDEEEENEHDNRNGDAHTNHHRLVEPTQRTQVPLAICDKQRDHAEEKCGEDNEESHHGNASSYLHHRQEVRWPANTRLKA